MSSGQDVLQSWSQATETRMMDSALELRHSALWKLCVARQKFILGAKRGTFLVDFTFHPLSPDFEGS